MVRHIGLNGGMCPAGRQACFCVIERFVKTKPPKHFQAFQVGHILQHRLRLQREPQHRCIRRDNQVILQLAFIAQLGYAKSLVLVVKVDIKGEVARFGDTPGNLLFQPVTYLCIQRSVAAIREKRAGVVFGEQRRH